MSGIAQELISWTESFTGILLTAVIPPPPAASGNGANGNATKAASPGNGANGDATAAASPGDGANGTVMSAAPGGGSAHGKKHAPARGHLSATGAMTLVDTLGYLAQDKYYRKEGAPGPGKLNATGERDVDALLQQAADVVNLWADSKTRPEALKNWRAVAPRLTALLNEAQDPAGLAFPAQYLQPARTAMSTIEDNLAAQVASQNLDDEINATATPEMSQGLDAKELKKLEPVLIEWRKVASSPGVMGNLAQMHDLSKALDLYFSTSDPMGKLEAFRKAGLLKQDSILPELRDRLVGLTVSTAAAATEKGIEIASAQMLKGVAGAKESVHALEGRLKIVKVAGGLVAAYELAKGTQKLIEGIENDDWHEIAEGGATLAMGAISTAEVTGLIESSTAAPATAGIIIVWATVDAILSAAELARWGKKAVELEAFKNMVRDIRKLVPDGKQLTAAVKLMNGTDGASDSIDAGNNERYRKYAQDAAHKVSSGLSALIKTHFDHSDPHTVGGYPELVNPVLPDLRRAFAPVNAATPEMLVNLPNLIGDAFNAMVKAVQAMMDEEARTNEAA